MSAPDTAIAVYAPDGVGLGDDDVTDNATNLRVVHDLSAQRQRRSVERTDSYRRRTTRHLQVLVVFDLLVAVLAASAVQLLTGAGSARFRSLAIPLAIASVVWPVSVAIAGGYHRRNLETGTGVRATGAAAAGATLALILPSAWTGSQSTVLTVALMAPVIFACSVAGRLGLRRARRHAVLRGVPMRRAVLVGDLEAVTRVHDAMQRERYAGFDVVGVAIPDTESGYGKAAGLPVAGAPEAAAELAAELDAHAIVVAGSLDERLQQRLSWSVEGQDIDILLDSGLRGAARSRIHVESYNELALVQVDHPRYAGWARQAKRAIDVIATSLGLLLIWPLLAAVALLIKLEDRGPVIFKQTRVGIDGTTFTMYKFRSMVVDAETRLAELANSNEGAGPLFKMKHDPRTTRVGRFIRRYSIDELPQLFNVLNGSMTLVGPRPALEREVAEYVDDTRRRLNVTPGLTGLWQVSGRSLLSWDDAVALDLRYVDNWTLGLDLKILARTWSAVIGKNGAF